MIRLLVDSASDYTQEEIENKNLYFVPLQIQIEGKNYLDGVDIVCSRKWRSGSNDHFTYWSTQKGDHGKLQ